MSTATAQLNERLELDPSSSWTPAEREFLEHTERSLLDGVALKNWWKKLEEEDAYQDRFELSRTQNRPDTAFGFFGEAMLDGERKMPAMGCIQEMFFDRPKIPMATDRDKKKAETTQSLNVVTYPLWLREQVQQYALRYFMRVSDFTEPEAYPDQTRSTPPAYLRPVSWCPTGHAEYSGFGFAQVCYKDAATGIVYKFHEEEKYKIVDLRELGEKYEWIMLKVNIFDFRATAAPFGANGPQMVLPMAEESYLVMSKDFITNNDSPSDGDLGRYGLGYAFIKDPKEGVLGYGPGRFDAAFQTIDFRVRPNGEILTHMAFVANRPDKVLNISIDPMTWTLRMADMVTGGGASRMEPVKKFFDAVPRPGGIDVMSAYITAANAMTGGFAERELCVSKKQLEKDLLLQHFVQHYKTISGSIVTWRLIPDWLDEKNLPDWVIQGCG